VPTIIITADDAPETRERCLSAGTAAYLCKPFDDRALLAMVARLVRGASEP
jgi:DNA-binding response OmpR family regulator